MKPDRFEIILAIILICLILYSVFGIFSTYFFSAHFVVSDEPQFNTDDIDYWYNGGDGVNIACMWRNATTLTQEDIEFLYNGSYEVQE